MNVKKFLVSTLAVGVVGNIMDFIVQGNILQGMYLSKMAIVRQDTWLGWFVLADFVTAFVLVWVYDRVYNSFAPGPAGGASFGFYAGVLFAFPTFIVMHLMLVGFPYSLSWIYTVYGVVFYVISGAVAGATYKK